MGLKIAEPITLPCGLVLPNRLVKAAMAEQMSDGQYLPDHKFVQAYGKWADGGWGLVMTGSVQVDATYLDGPRDTAIDRNIESKVMEPFQRLAEAAQKHGTATIVQLNHPGRQSVLGAGKKGFFTKNVAPSPVLMKFGDDLLSRMVSRLAFGMPREMSVKDIKDVVEQFAYSARLIAESKFAGIEIHAAHGYLLSQFLSSETNHRNDAYGGSPANRAKIIVDIIEAVRKVVPKSFCIGIKLNSVDHQSSEDVAAFVEQINLIVAAGIDFLEISGGTYENPRMMTGETITPSLTEKQPSTRTLTREAFFLEFADAIRSHFPSIPLMVTGGFRTRSGMEKAVSSGSCDLIGIGRPACLEPEGPKKIIFNQKEIRDEEARLRVEQVKVPLWIRWIPVKGVGSGIESLYYSRAIQNLAH